MKKILALGIALLACATLLACPSAPDVVTSAVDASIIVADLHLRGASSPYPTGTGLEAVSGGQQVAAAITGDAGFLLTSTGTSSLPTYQPAPSGFTAGGDLTGTSTSQTVAKVNGTTYPAGGSLTTGTYPRVTGSSAVTYSAIPSGDLTTALTTPPAIGGTTPAAGTFSALTANTIAFAAGNAPGFGRTTDTYSSDADKTLSSSVYNFHEISISGTQTRRKCIIPLTAGSEWVLTNASTSDFLAIGASGTGVWVPQNASCYIRANGTNILGLACTMGANWQPNDFASTLGVTFPVPMTEVTMGSGTNYPLRNAVLPATFTDASTWQTIATWTPTVNTAELWDLSFFAVDFNGASNTLIPNFHKCNGEFVILALNGGTIYFVPQAGAASASSSTTTLAGVSCTVETGCTSNSSNAGCAAGSSPSFTFQVLSSSGVVSLQAKGIDAHAYKSVTSLQTLQRIYGTN